MRARRFVFAGAGLAVLLGGTAVVLDQMAGQPGRLAHSAATGQAAVQLGTASGGTAAGQGGESGAAAAGSDGAATQAGEIQSAGRLVLPRAGEVLPSTGEVLPSPSEVLPRVDKVLPPVDKVLPRRGEVLPPVSGTLPGLPPISPLAALIRGPLPAAASAHGKLVDGFPADVLRFPTGTMVVSTGVSSAGQILQVTADALVPSSQDSVIGHFQQIMVPLEFWSEAMPAPDGQRAMRFSRGNDALTLTTSTTATGTTRFMLLANLHATGAQ